MNAPDGLAPTLPGFDVASVRAQFPVLAQRVHDDRRLAYLDNAATTQKPEAVLQALDHYYRHDNSNVHRGVHALAARATKGYEDARARIARFAGAEVAGVLVALDRQERGTDGRSPLAALAEDECIATMSVATLSDVVTYAKQRGLAAERVQAIKSYRARHGIDGVS